MASIEEQEKRRLALEKQKGSGKKPTPPGSTMGRRLEERIRLIRQGVPVERAVEISQQTNP